MLTPESDTCAYLHNGLFQLLFAPPPPVGETWNFQGRGCINHVISRGEGGLTLNFNGRGALTLNIQGRRYINLGISRRGVY
jgi:hypothetical protein